jgi:hypothetical protein
MMVSERVRFCRFSIRQRLSARRIIKSAAEQE